MKQHDVARQRRTVATVAKLTMALLLVGCSAGAPAASVGPTLDPSVDKLAQVRARGTLVLWTDTEYPPQSFAVEGAARQAGTRCASNQLTAPEVSGYDAETGKLVASALGVEPCFVTTPFDSMIAGSWGDRYDIAWGSGAITVDRMERLYVTQPYYSTPASFFVRADAAITDPTQLAGKEIGACSGCTHQRYLERTLELPGETIDFLVDAPQIVTFNSEVPGLSAVEAGDIEAFLCSEPVGMAAIAEGAALKVLDRDAYYTHKTGYVDRDLELAVGPFLEAVNDALADLHAGGQLKALSIDFFGQDYASPAAAFDLAELDQVMP